MADVQMCKSPLECEKRIIDTQAVASGGARWGCLQRRQNGSKEADEVNPDG